MHYIGVKYCQGSITLYNPDRHRDVNYTNNDTIGTKSIYKW